MSIKSAIKQLLSRSLLTLPAIPAMLFAAEFPSLPDTEISFELESMDSLENLDTSVTEQKPWKNSLAYSAGYDDKGKNIVNRGEWRVQWEHYNNDIFWQIDTKLRLLYQSDLQHDNNSEYDADLNLIALLLQYSQQSQSYKIGFQTVTLGYMDMLRVSNVFSPQDLSEAVFTSPEDASIGQLIAKLSYYARAGQFDIFLNLTPATNQYPGTTLDQQLSQAFNTDVMLNDQQPDSLDKIEWLLRWQSSSNQHDYQVLFGNLLQNDPDIEITSLAGPLNINLNYPRYDFTAGAYSYTEGNHQFKTEISLQQDISPLDTAHQAVDQTTLALGWEYSANGNYTLLFETARTRRNLPATISGYIAADLIETDIDQTALSWRKSFFNETLNSIIYLGYNNPGSQRIRSLSLQYSPADAWRLEFLYTALSADNNNSLPFRQQSLLKASLYW